MTISKASVSDFITQLNQNPNNIQFSQTMEVIQHHYRYTPTLFTNGQTVNAAGSNEGSCKLFAFAKLNNLNKQQTLACFGDYYRLDVLNNPSGVDHPNIRNFMITGWVGVKFEGDALNAVA